MIETIIYIITAPPTILYLFMMAGIFIVKIHRDGAAFKDGRLRVGDKILSLNGVALDGLRHEEVG